MNLSATQIRQAMMWGGFFLILCVSGVLDTEVTKINIRFALMAEELFRYGIGVFPTINGVEYCDYPVTWILLSAGGALRHDFFRNALLVLPTILTGAYTVTMTFLVAERLQPGDGKLAAGVLLLTPEFIHLATGVGLDMPIAAIGITLLYLFYAPDPVHNCRLWFPLLTVSAFFIRGPMGVVLTGGLTAGFWIMNRNWRAVFLFGISGFVSMATALGIWYVVVHAQGGNALWQEFLRSQIGSRFYDSNHWEYFVNGFFAFAPVTFLATGNLLSREKMKSQAKLLPILGAVLLPVIVMSIPGCKHLRYLGVILPPLAVLAASGVRNIMQTTFYQNKIAPWHQVIFHFTAAASFCGMLGLLIATYFLPPPLYFPWKHCLFAIGITGAIPFFKRRAELNFAPAMIFLACVMIPFEAALENSRDFVRIAEGIRSEKVWLYNLGPDHDDLKFVFSASSLTQEKIGYLYDHRQQFRNWDARMYPHHTISEIQDTLKEQDLIILRHTSDDRALLREELRPYGWTIRCLGKGRMGHREFCICMPIKINS